MALILVQTDTIAPCGTILACTSPADGLATVPQARQAEEDGSAGSGELSVTINKADIQAGVMFESPGIGQTTWQSGTYTVRLNVTTAVANLNLIEVHVCRVNSSCVSQETVGSSVGLGISMGITGVKNVDVEGSEQSANAADRIYIVFIFQAVNHTNPIFGFTPDQNIDTSIVLDGVTPKSVPDSGSGADSVGVKVKAILSDSGAGADDIAELKALLALADPGSGVDALTVKQFRDVSDSGMGAEEVKSRTSLSILDSGIGAEAFSILSKLTVSDPGVGADIMSILNRLLMEDSGVGTDDVSASEPTTPKGVQDSGTGQDALAVKAILNILDDAFGADSLMVRQFRAVSESGAGVGALAIKTLLALSDSGLGSEALSILSKVAVQDAGLAAGILAVLSKVSVQDLAAGIDDAVVKTIAGRDVADEGVGSDMVSALLRTYYPLPFEAEARKRAFDIGAEGRGLSPKERKRAFQAKGRYKK